MKTNHARLFMNGRSQAVRIPAAYRFEHTKELKILRQGNKLILEPVYHSWEPFLKALDQFPENIDFPRAPIDFSSKALFK